MTATSGYQELVVDHPDATMSLERLTSPHVAELLKLYRERLALLARQPGIRHIQLTRNVGSAAGAAYDHPHAQLLAVPVGNRWLDEEMAAAQAHFASHARCLFCDVIAAELSRKERFISYNERFIALAPYASKPRSRPGCCLASTAAALRPWRATRFRTWRSCCKTWCEP